MANSSRFVSYIAWGSKGIDLAAALRCNPLELEIEELSGAKALKVARAWFGGRASHCVADGWRDVLDCDASSKQNEIDRLAAWRWSGAVKSFGRRFARE